MWLCNRRFFTLGRNRHAWGLRISARTWRRHPRPCPARGGADPSPQQSGGVSICINPRRPPWPRHPANLYPDLYPEAIGSQSVVSSPSQGERRFNAVGTLSIDLKDQDGVSVTKGKVEAFTSYSATGSSLATNRARQDASKRLMTILAENTLQRLNTHTQDAE